MNILLLVVTLHSVRQTLAANANGYPCTAHTDCNSNKCDDFLGICIALEGTCTTQELFGDNDCKQVVPGVLCGNRCDIFADIDQPCGYDPVNGGVVNRCNEKHDYFMVSGGVQVLFPGPAFCDTITNTCKKFDLGAGSRCSSSKSCQSSRCVNNICTKETKADIEYVDFAEQCFYFSSSTFYVCKGGMSCDKFTHACVINRLESGEVCTSSSDCSEYLECSLNLDDEYTCGGHSNSKQSVKKFFSQISP